MVQKKFAWGSKCDQTLSVEHVCSDSKYERSQSFKQVS